MSEKIKEFIAALAEVKRAKAFLYRNFALDRRYLSWVIVFIVYDIVNGATIVLIGVAAGDSMQTLNLMLGVLMWTYLSKMFTEIGTDIAYERWEGTIEYTFMAPVSRFTHMLGTSLHAAVFAMVRVVIIAIMLGLFATMDFSGANIAGVFAVLAISTLSFIGLGMMAATFSLISTEHGAQATNILNAILMLISGVYFPLDVLPGWLRPFSVLSPATYALSACRKMLGLGIEGSEIGALQGQSISSASNELMILFVTGILAIPLGLLVFSSVENWAKHTGNLQRSG